MEQAFLFNLFPFLTEIVNLRLKWSNTYPKAKEAINLGISMDQLYLIFSNRKTFPRRRETVNLMLPMIISIFLKLSAYS